MSKDQLPPLHDLGLDYQEAGHGVQSAVAFEMEIQPPGQRDVDPKHMRVGVDMGKSDQYGLVRLLIDKGVFTWSEYAEYLRLAANEELARREAEHPGITFR